jgi:D-3-phosphoglycerate dehydrogenase
VHIAPEAPEVVASAVRAAGGELGPLQAADAVVWLGHGPRELPALPDRVRWVQLPSAGVEPYFAAGRITPDGPRFTSAAGVYGGLVAEHALALLLAGVHALQVSARARAWITPPVATLEGATVAIVGAGGIGRALIERLAPHRVEVLAVTRRGHPVPGAARTLPAERVEEVWPAADHVVLAAPATDATRHLVGAAQLAAMREHAWLVNVARGSLVDTHALVAALREERIGGAALDVTDPEPLPEGHPLWAEPRALIAMHHPAPEDETEKRLAERVRANVERFAADEPLLAPVDPAAGY